MAWSLLVSSACSLYSPKSALVFGCLRSFDSTQVSADCSVGLSLDLGSLRGFGSALEYSIGFYALQGFGVNTGFSFPETVRVALIPPQSLRRSMTT